MNCPSCQQQVSPDDKFCGNCGHHLLAEQETKAAYQHPQDSTKIEKKKRWSPFFIILSIVIGFTVLVLGIFLLGDYFDSSSYMGSESFSSLSSNSESEEDHNDKVSAREEKKLMSISPGHYILDNMKSEMKWTGSLLKHGIINLYSHAGGIEFDRGDFIVEDSRIKEGFFTVDMTTISLSDENYNRENSRQKLLKHLGSSDFFDVNSYPTASFKIISSSDSGLVGKMTIKGVSNNETIKDYSITPLDGVIVIKGKMALNPSKYNITWQFPALDKILSDEVEISFKLFFRSSTKAPIDNSLSDGLIAHFPFDKSSNDLSNNALKVKKSNFSYGRDSQNQLSAARFNGNNEFIQTLPDNGLAVSSSASFSFWLMPYQTGANSLRSVVVQGTGFDTTDNWEVMLESDGKISLRQNNVPSGVASSSEKIDINKWSHLAMTFDRGLVRFYLDGAYLNEARLPNRSFRSTSDGIKIGQREYDGANGDFIGKIDELRIYNRVLTHEEIQSLFRE